MRFLTSIAITTLLLYSGCKKEAPAPSASETAPAPSSKEPAPSEAATPGSNDSAAAPNSVPPQNNAPEIAAAPAVENTVTDRMALEALPEPNADGFFMMMQKAANDCRPDDPRCEPVRQLAARIPTALDEIEKLAKSGTDQQKKAIRRALLLTDHAPAIPLLLSLAIDQFGKLDTDVIQHALALRANGLAPILKSYLARATGTNAQAAILALGRLGHSSAISVAKHALTLENVKPYIGDICQALARLGAKDTLATMQALGSRLDGSRRQREGCRNSEAAMRLIDLPSPVSLLLDGKQYRGLGVTAEQRTPRTITLSFTDAPKPSCEARGTALVEVDIPLEWNGEPLIGKPLVPSVRVGADSLAPNTAYYTRFDALELKAGSPISGLGFMSHVPVKGSHRLVLQGTFKGIYCGAAK